jgi:hypothetical protein
MKLKEKVVRALLHCEEIEESLSRMGNIGFVNDNVAKAYNQLELNLAHLKRMLDQVEI